MPVSSGSVHYATNVHHYDSALDAMRENFARITLQRRFEPSPSLTANMKRLPLVRHVGARFDRRARESPSVDRLAGLGGAQLAFPVLNLFGLTAPGSVVRAVNHESAKRVAAAIRSTDVFQFVEGLGHVTIRKTPSSYRYSIMERRNLHHEVFEQEIQTYAGFPHRSKLDPLRNYLVDEYDAADKIVVYSTVAASSFLDRGFEPGRLVVVPLTVHRAFGGTDGATVHAPTADEHELLYVGRGDAFKGIDVAVAAVRKLGRPYRLTVAGPAPREVIEWLTHSEQVSYLGVVSRNELRELYQRAAALIAPSVESFGLAVIDAAACGLHVICRETTGAAEFLKPGQRTIVIGRDPSDWAAAIEKLRVRPRADRVGVHAYASSGLSDSSEAFTSLYRQLLD